MSYVLRSACLFVASAALALFTTVAEANDAIQQEPAAGSGAPGTAPRWQIRLPKEDKVSYKGVVSFDGAGTGAAPMLYPAPNFAGLLAGILTHAVINESAKESQKSQIQIEADKVLAPYQAILDGYTHKELVQRAVAMTSIGSGKNLIGPSEQADSGAVIEHASVFSMTQDQSALVLDNAISVAEPGGATRRFVVRVVSQARDDNDIVSFWSGNQGARLKEESAALFAMSLDIALRNVTGSLIEKNQSFKTVRYFEGKVEKMERAQVLDQYCNRLIIKSLKAWFLSVPARIVPATGDTPPQCDDKPGLAAAPPAAS